MNTIWKNDDQNDAIFDELRFNVESEEPLILGLTWSLGLSVCLSLENSFSVYCKEAVLWLTVKYVSLCQLPNANSYHSLTLQLAGFQTVESEIHSQLTHPPSTLRHMVFQFFMCCSRIPSHASVLWSIPPHFLPSSVYPLPHTAFPALICMLLAFHKSTESSYSFQHVWLSIYLSKDGLSGAASLMKTASLLSINYH